MKEQIYPFDPADARYNTPDKTIYGYDPVGNLASVSAPPSQGQTVRTITTYSYYDNGWVRSSTDPWDIATTYDYNVLGQQTARTVTSAGGSSARSMSWDYHPDGSLKSRSDDGVPVGLAVELVDNSDTPNATVTGSWATSTAGSGYQGYDYRTHPAGTGSSSVAWKATVPQDGNYTVSVRFPAVSGAATNATYKVDYAGGSVTKTVSQATAAGTWVSLGTFAFTRGSTTQKITLTDQAGGTVVADAVKLVRDNAGDTDSERKSFGYGYDPNGNLVALTDGSPGAAVDSYAVTYDGLDRVSKVEEKAASVVKHTTTFTYNANSAPLTRKHDGASATFAYDPRNLLASVTNAESATDPAPKLTKYNYTGRGQLFQETKANGNIVSHSYWADWLPRTTEEKKPAGTLVASHTLKYSPNGDRTSDVASVQNADNHAAYLNTTTTYTYDPRDRIAQVTKAPTGGTASVESYVHDANDNVISQTVNGTSTSYSYDRNRLLSATSAGATAAYNYDPFGRLDTVTSAGQLVEDYSYDGFDRTAEHRKLVSGSLASTRYTYDPLDRTASRTEKAGTPAAKTTEFAYLGLSGQLLDERVAGALMKTYQYGPGGARLSQTTIKADGTKVDGFYGYNPHTDVETVTDSAGDTRSTYGYTAYGSNDTTGFTGIDKPDPAQPDKAADNVYRFNAKRWDSASGTYDMGFRDYNPGLNRFLTRDTYNGALADLTLGTDPYTRNRYTLAGGNPISRVELDGHDLCDLRALGCVDPDWDDANGSAVTEFPEATRTTTADGQTSINGVPISSADPDADALAAQVDKWAPRFKEAYNLPTDQRLNRTNTALLIGDICAHDRNFCGERFRKEAALLYDKMLLADDPGVLLGTALTPNGGVGRTGARAVAEEAGDEWARLSGILRSAARGKGNFGVGSATREEALAAGRAWVGEGFRVASDGRSLVSSDGLRVFRPPSFKSSLGRYQANFEYRVDGQVTGKMIGNGHLDITDMMP